MSARMTQRTASIQLSFVLGLSALQLISWGSVFYGFSLFMSPIEAALQLSRAESSLAFSVALLLEGLAAFSVGRWIDRGHERAVMTVGSVLLGVAFLAHSQIESAWHFYAVWAVMGLGLSATLYPPAFAVLTRRFPDHFRRAIILLSFLGGLASTVFIPLVDWLIHALGWRDALVALGGLHLLVCAPGHALLLRHAPAGRAQCQDRSPPAPLREHLNNRTFWLLGVFVVLLMAVTAALPAHMVNLLREQGMTETWVIAVPAAIGVLQVVGRAVLFTFEHRLDVHQVNRWVPCLIPLGLAVLWLGGASTLAASMFVVIYGMGNGMFTIVKGTAVAQYVSQAHVGSLNGALGLPMALARAAAPWVMGLMWQPDQGYAQALLLMMALACLGVLALWRAQVRVRAGSRRR
jgi:MFS family permease